MQLRPVTGKSTRRHLMVWIRLAGFVALIVAAVLVWLLMEPDDISVSAELSESGTEFISDQVDYASAVSSVLAAGEANEELADSAPQQTVVNGWVARDLLAVQSQQLTDIISGQAVLAGNQGAQSEQLAEFAQLFAEGENQRDDRIPLLLVLTVGAVAWHGLTTAGSSRRFLSRGDHPAAQVSEVNATGGMPSALDSSYAQPPRV
jgi:hypothetical protein